MSHCVTVCCSVLQCVAAAKYVLSLSDNGMSMLLLSIGGASTCCSVLQCVAVCCSVLQCVAAVKNLLSLNDN